MLVRAVPTGALRRTLSLTLRRRGGAGSSVGDCSRDAFEPALPRHALAAGAAPRRGRAGGVDGGCRAPRAGPRGAAAMRCSPLALAACAVRSIVKVGARASQAVAGFTCCLRRCSRCSPSPAGSATLLLLGVAVGIADRAWLRPVRMIKRTRYFITNKRVLIVRGDEELHLDRRRIAYVIPTTRASRRAGRAGQARRLHDVFLVLDGPQGTRAGGHGAPSARGTTRTCSRFSRRSRTLTWCTSCCIRPPSSRALPETGAGLGRRRPPGAFDPARREARLPIGAERVQIGDVLGGKYGSTASSATAGWGTVLRGRARAPRRARRGQGRAHAELGASPRAEGALPPGGSRRRADP